MKIWHPELRFQIIKSIMGRPLKYPDRTEGLRKRGMPALLYLRPTAYSLIL
jgi:hypothetical protein